MTILKKSNAFLTMLIAVLCIASFSSSAQETYGAENEKVPKQGDTIKEFYGNSTALKKLKYRDTKMYIVKSYFEDGKNSELAIYPLENLKNKTVLQFYGNGKLKLVASYEMGAFAGVYKEFHSNGKLAVIGTYDKGKKTGDWKSYNETGKLLLKEIYKEGVFIKKSTTGEG